MSAKSSSESMSPSQARKYSSVNLASSKWKSRLTLADDGSCAAAVSLCGGVRDRVVLMLLLRRLVVDVLGREVMSRRASVDWRLIIGSSGRARGKAGAPSWCSVGVAVPPSSRVGVNPLARLYKGKSETVPEPPTHEYR